jgi:hypothetical protein
MLKIDISSMNAVLKNIEVQEAKVKTALLAVTNVVALKMEAWAKQNAPWTDRTGTARRNLKAHVSFAEANKLVISMSHHVDYGVWLELAHERKYSILEKAIEQHKVDFIRQWQRIAKG